MAKPDRCLSAAKILTRRGVLFTGATALPFMLAGCESALPRGQDGVFPPTYADGDAARFEAALQPAAPALYYVTAPDCTWCTWWHTSYQPGFERSAARSKLRFVTLHQSTLKGGTGKDEAWPLNLRWVRDRLQRDKRPDGKPVTSYSPAWALVRGTDYLAGASGISGWESVMWPAIQRETGST